MLGYKDEIVDLIARDARRHSVTCIKNSALTKVRFNERLERYDKMGGVFSSLTVNVGRNTAETHSKNPLC